MRLPTYRELRRFVDVEGWADKDAIARKPKGNHHRYVFTTPMGEHLYTRISHGNGQYGDAGLFQHILKDQLRVSEEQFWAAVDKGIKPERPTPQDLMPSTAIDAKLARILLTKVGLTSTELVGMTSQEAKDRWQAWLAQHP